MLFTSVIVNAQVKDTLVKQLDSLNKKTDSLGFQNNNTNPKAYNSATRITGSSYLKLLWSNYKQQLTAPFYISRDSWKTVGAFGAVTGALALADQPVQRWALKAKSSSQAASRASKFVTNTGGVSEIITLGAIGTYGFVFKNEKMKTTTFLASQAYLTSATLSFMAKTLSGRQRPSVYSENRVTAKPTFKGPFADLGTDIEGKKMNSSFPSAHTSLAFSAATVYAMEYKNIKWVPVVSYTAASLIGLSRLTENRHWATDVLVGAALGHICGRQVVNNYHRYAKIKTEPSPEKKLKKQRKPYVSYNLNYMQGNLVGGLTLYP